MPDDYKTFSGFEDKKKKYYEWGFKNRKKNELKELLYKGAYTEDPYENPEPCDIIGYLDDYRIIIELSRSKKILVIDRRYLKQMQNKHFRQNQPDSDAPYQKDIPQHILDRIDIPDSYVVYDLETTGLSYLHDEIIEIAAIKIQEGVVTDTFQTLVKPSIHVDQIIERITGISNSMLVSAPDLQNILPGFKAFLGDSVLVGHNIQTFDNYFLNVACYKCGMESINNECIDTLDLSRTIYPGLDSYKLFSLVEAMGISKNEQFHRALADCHYTQQVMEHIINDINNQTATLVMKASRPTEKKKASSRSVHSNKYPKHADLRKIHTSKESFDESNPFFGKNCVFTGELSRYSREEAAQLIADKGGSCENNITKKTNFLILSASSDPNKKSGKQQKAEAYGVRIIQEKEFYELLGADVE